MNPRMNPLAILLLLAMLATLACLMVGLGGFFQGGAFNERYGNRLMRARVGLQLLAVTCSACCFSRRAEPAHGHSHPHLYPRRRSGPTSLGDGTRVAKHAAASPPTARSTRPTRRSGWPGCTPPGEADAMLARIQNDLFDLGADLCRPGSDADGERRCASASTQVERLEREIDG